ncbi:MAG: hypothetical protein ACRDRT_12235 [Pseudonocardiaceae bacterium]
MLRNGARWLGQQCEENIMDAVPEDITNLVVEQQLQEWRPWPDHPSSLHQAPSCLYLHSWW